MPSSSSARGRSRSRPGDESVFLAVDPGALKLGAWRFDLSTSPRKVLEPLGQLIAIHQIGGARRRMAAERLCESRAGLRGVQPPEPDGPRDGVRVLRGAGGSDMPAGQGTRETGVDGPARSAYSPLSGVPRRGMRGGAATASRGSGRCSGDGAPCDRRDSRCSSRLAGTRVTPTTGRFLGRRCSWS